MQIRYLDGHRLRRALVAACDYTEGKRRELNRINVFPVPDGDTGTNLALTLRAVGDHLRRTPDPQVGRIAGEAAEAAVLGARGNSGMMLSHFLLGFAARVQGRARITTEEFAEALEAGVSALHQAIEKPVEGTILTVMRETARAASDIREQTPDFLPFLRSILARAQEALEATPDLLPALRKAGVVDAGAKGFVHLLEGTLTYVLSGDLVVGRAPDLPAASGDEADAGDPIAALDFDEAEETYRFCTEALVRGSDLPEPEEVKEKLRGLGDSLVVIRTGEVLKIHIHTDEPERVFEYLKGLGRLAAHKAEDMRVQHAAISDAASGGHRSLARRPLSVVTESAHDLPDEVIRAHGIQVVPLLLMDGDDVLRDGVDITAEEFHARMDQGDRELPTTSQPAPASFLEAFHRAAEEGEEILYVGLSSTLSGTFQSAEAAAARFDGTPLHLFDSRSASLLEGLLVLKAAELGELGTPVPEILERLERARERSGIFFTVDRFERLLASGRVGKGKAWLGTFLKLKPILALDEKGVVYPAGRALGRSRVLEKVLDLVAEKVPPGSGPVRFGIVHVSRPGIVDEVSERVRERWGEGVEIVASPAAPVLATHLGPGAWGLAWLSEEA